MPAPAASRTHFSPHQAVTYVGLQGNGLGGGLSPSWGNLTGLQLLDLGRNRLGRDFPPEWGGMRGLQALNLVRDGVLRLFKWCTCWLGGGGHGARHARPAGAQPGERRRKGCGGRSRVHLLAWGW